MHFFIDIYAMRKSSAGMSCWKCPTEPYIDKEGLGTIFSIWFLENRRLVGSENAVYLALNVQNRASGVHPMGGMKQKSSSLPFWGKFGILGENRMLIILGGRKFRVRIYFGAGFKWTNKGKWKIVVEIDGKIQNIRVWGSEKFEISSQWLKNVMRNFGG